MKKQQYEYNFGMAWFQEKWKKQTGFSKHKVILDGYLSVPRSWIYFAPGIKNRTYFVDFRLKKLIKIQDIKEAF